MKFLLINKFFKIVGGSETYFFSVGNALTKRGYDVIYFSMKDTENFKCNQEQYFVKKASFSGTFIEKARLIKNMFYSKEAYNKLERLIQVEKPDVAILNLVHKNLSLSILDVLKKNNVKVLWIMHDLILLCPNYTMRNGNGKICEACVNKKYFNCVKNKCVKHSTFLSFLSYMETKFIDKKRFYDKVDCFITPSLFYKRALSKGSFPEEKIYFLRNPLSDNFEFSDKIFQGDYFLYYGRLSEEKGVYTLIKAFLELNYKLFIVGKGADEANLKSLAQTSKFNNIKFLGFKSGIELNNLIKTSKCVVLPSEWYENCPYSAMEAMALSKPLIVSNYGGLPELVDNYKNGFVFNNFNELKKCITLIGDMPTEKYYEFCKASYIKAKKDFDMSSYIDKMINIINRI